MGGMFETPMSRKYPRLGGFNRYKEDPGPVFCPCGVKAVGRLTIETNWFRGDDKTSPRCAAHKDCIKVPTK